MPPIGSLPFHESAYLCTTYITFISFLSALSKYFTLFIIVQLSVNARLRRSTAVHCGIHEVLYPY